MKKDLKQNKSNFKKEFFILLLTICVLLISASIISYYYNDYISMKSDSDYFTKNWMGTVGVIISNVFFQVFGKSSYFVMIILLLLPLYILFASENLKRKTLSLATGLFFIIWALSILLSIVNNNIGPQGGGFIGGFFGKISYKYTGLIGSYFLIILFFAFGFSKLTGLFKISNIFKKLLIKINVISNYEINKEDIKQFVVKKKMQIKESLPAFLTIVKQSDKSVLESDSKTYFSEKINTKDTINENQNLVNETFSNSNNKTIEDLEHDFISLKDKINSYGKNPEIKSIDETNNYNINKENNDYIIETEIINENSNKIFEVQNTNEAELSEEEEIDIEISADEIEFIQTVKDEKEKSNNPLPINKSLIIDNEKKKLEKSNPFKTYKKPPLDILFISEEINLEGAKEEITETARKIIETLKEFKIELTKLTVCYRGPVLTRYEFETAPGIKMEKIERYSNNIAYSLASTKVRIIAPVPGKQAIGVEVPNKIRKDVLLGDILRTKEYKETKGKLPLALGKDISGKPIVADLSTMPHLLIAGTTGSGKSVCINSVLFSLLYNKRPEELRLILIDPKRVELKAFGDIPHLLTPIVTDPKYAAMALNWSVNEMERRYELLEELGCRDIKRYNEKINELKSNGIVEYEPLHYIVIVIDELADLMLIAKKEIENVVARLAAKSRAAGIHLIFATQSPRADIITGIIKANFQPRIAFAVATKMESRIILDTSGADKLLGKGDMLFYQPGYEEVGAPIRVQGAFVSDKEVYQVTDFLRYNCEPDYVEEILEEGETENIIESLSPSDEPIYHEAVRIVVDEKKASASYLQRRLQIGYNRAARMIEYMESEGLIGKAQGSKPREVLIDYYPY